MLVKHILNKKLLVLNVFDKPVKDFLTDELKKMGYDPSEFEVVFDAAIRSAKEMIHESETSLPSPILRSKLGEHSFNYLRGVLSQTEKLSGAHKRIKSYGSVFLVGAGISFESGMPLSDILGDILRFCKAGSYDELRNDSDKCLRFKNEFRKICLSKAPGQSHKSMALNYPKHIWEIVCLNWDNLIERGASEIGKSVSKVNEDRIPVGKSHLWKFHGDVELIGKDNERGKGGWVLPDEKGYVFDCFAEYIKTSGLGSSIFTFLIVGYSEKEEEIYNAIIDQFEDKPPRPTYRIGLDLSRLKEDNYIVGPSAFVLKEILPLK